MIHRLKTQKEYLLDVMSGNKTFEVRKNDRDFKVGDILDLILYEHGEMNFNAHENVVITYILDDEEYCKEGFVILGVKLIKVHLDELKENK